MRARSISLGEPATLCLGVSVFLLLARLASSAPDARSSGSHGGTAAGPVRFEATLGQSRLQRREDATVFVDVRLNGASLASRDGAALPIDLALVLDVSGKMAKERKLGLVSEACLGISRQLGPDDRIAVVTFADSARTILGLDGKSVEALVSGEGTSISAGLERGAAELRRRARPGAARRILLVTDGQPNRGVTSAAGLAGIASRLAAEGISVSTLGLGLDFDARLLAALADAGGGSYHQVDAPERVAAIYKAELRALRTLVARRVTLTLAPAPGVEIAGLVEWKSTRDEKGFHVLVGDFEAERSAKVVACLRVPAGMVGKDLVSVSIEAQDARTGAFSQPQPIAIGAGAVRTHEEALASASKDPGVHQDLEDAIVAVGLETARDCAHRRDVRGTIAALECVRRVRPTLEYMEADGRVERKTVEQLGSELLAFVRTQKTIGTSEAIFREGDKERDGNLDYGMLSELNSTGLIDSVLGSGTKQGYIFQACYDRSTENFLWFSLANPGIPGTTGDRSFDTNQAGVIFYTTGQALTLDTSTCVLPCNGEQSADKFVQSVLIPTGK